MIKTTQFCQARAKPAADLVNNDKSPFDVQGRTNIAGAGCAGAMLVTFMPTGM
jgi:hypothetical protein